MNRILKFRVWDSKNKKFIKEIPHDEYMLDSSDWESDGLEEGTFQYPEHLRTFGDRLIWQQSIGFFDKNKKEVFEGDIVKFYKGNFDPENNEFEISKYSDDIFEIKCDLVSGCSELLDRLGDYGEVEVVGNIFENPELLVEKD